MASKGRAYMGDGFQGFGKYLEGLAASHLHQKDKRDITTVDDVKKDIDTDEHIAHDISQIITETTKHMTPAELACLASYIEESCKDYTDHVYEKEDAINDVQVAIDTIFDEYQDKFLPQILNRECSAGIYNDTATQLLVNDAYASAVVKSGTLQLDTIHRYVDHISTLSKIVIEGLRTAIQDHEVKVNDKQLDEDTQRDTFVDDVMHRDAKVDDDNDMSREINLDGFLIDAAAIAILTTLIPELLLRDYNTQG